MHYFWIFFMLGSFTAILAVIAGVWAMNRAVRKFAYYSISAKRIEVSCEEIPLFEHHYWTEHELRREWSLYGQDIFDAGYEVEGDWQPLTVQGVEHSQIVVRNVYKHARTGAALVLEAKIVKGFREFSDHTRRRISGGKRLAPGDANRLRKEVLANNYPEVGDKRYYVYLVKKHKQYEDDNQVEPFRHLEDALNWIQEDGVISVHPNMVLDFPAEIVASREGVPYFTIYVVEKKLF